MFCETALWGGPDDYFEEVTHLSNHIGEKKLSIASDHFNYSEMIRGLGSVEPLLHTTKEEIP